MAAFRGGLLKFSSIDKFLAVFGTANIRQALAPGILIYIVKRDNYPTQKHHFLAATLPKHLVIRSGGLSK